MREEYRNAISYGMTRGRFSSQPPGTTFGTRYFTIFQEPSACRQAVP